MQNIYGKTFLYCLGKKCPIQCLSVCSHLVSSNVIHSFMSHLYLKYIRFTYNNILKGGY